VAVLGAGGFADVPGVALVPDGVPRGLSGFVVLRPALWVDVLVGDGGGRYDDDRQKSAPASRLRVFILVAPMK